jgi:hypothetical protein
MQVINLTASVVKDKQAHEVASAILSKQFGGKKPTAVEINLAPCAKGLFRGHRDHANFEQAVKRHLIA